MGITEMTSAMTVWSGLDLRTGIEGGARAARESIRAAPPARRERGDRYELLALASRARPATFLDCSPLLAGDDPDGVAASAAWHDDLEVTWSLLYRPIAETGPREVEPYAIYLLGVNPPADLDEAGTAEFDDFYTNVHMREVAEQRRALRASRYELERALRSPARGEPRFLAAYEVDEAGSAQRTHVGPPYSRGPEVWQRHTTPWRFWYRRVAG